MRTTEGQPVRGRCLGDKAREIEVRWCQDNRGGCSGEGLIEAGEWLWPPLKGRAKKDKNKVAVQLDRLDFKSMSFRGANRCPFTKTVFRPQKKSRW